MTAKRSEQLSAVERDWIWERQVRIDAEARVAELEAKLAATITEAAAMVEEGGLYRDKLEAQNKALREALERFVRLSEIGIRKRGVGIGAVLIAKWDADEAVFYARAALKEGDEG